MRLRGYLIRKRPPPQDPPRTLGIGLRKSPRGSRFLVSGVPLCSRTYAATRLWDTLHVAGVLGQVPYLSLVHDALLALVVGHVVLREAVGPMVKRLIGCRVQGSGVKLH